MASVKRYVAADLAEEVRRDHVVVLRDPVAAGEGGPDRLRAPGLVDRPGDGAAAQGVGVVMVLCCSRHMFVRPTLTATVPGGPGHVTIAGTTRTAAGSTRYPLVTTSAVACRTRGTTRHPACRRTRPPASTATRAFAPRTVRQTVWVLPEPDVSAGADLPVRAVLPELLAALDPDGVAVLVAPPGSGKTTLVPLALAGQVPGRVIVAEPRRVAARAAARRMAALIGGDVGGAVGYAVRGDTRSGPETRVEVVTTGLLVARLQRDPELPGVGAVILDECHERHLDSDLALAFMVDVRKTIRPDLMLLATSATAQADRLAACLGGPEPAAPIVSVDVAPHPVEVFWCPPQRSLDPPHGTRVDPRLLDHVTATVRRALREADGDVLVFLPGVGEINAVAGRLADLGATLDVVALHGRLPAGTQDAALRPGRRRRVVLASSVAESSLTVPAVRIVVDAGLSRVPRTDHARGLGSLVTVRVSRASAHQRAGRSGREAPGRVYRCWSAAEHDRLPAHAEPEIAVADLTDFALELACWGHPDGDGLALPDAPPAAAMTVARATLRALGAIDGAGRATDRGRAMAAVGAHPRLARALLDGAQLVGSTRAAQIVALLSDDAAVGRQDDLVAVWRRLRDRVDPAASTRWREEARRLGATVAGRGRAVGPPDDLAAALVVGLAYPERLARTRQPGAGSYLMAGGTAATLGQGSVLAGTAWLAIAVADRAPGQANARIRLAAAIDEATAREAGAPLLAVDEEVGWSGNELVGRRIERLGALILAERRLAAPDRALVQAALLDALRADGLSALDWSPGARHMRDRLAFCRRVLGEPWPDVSDEALLARAPQWLAPELARARRRDDLRRTDVTAALRRLLPWQQAARLDRIAPERIQAPGGSRVRVDYADPDAPVLAIRVQQAFGWPAAPTVADGRVPVVLHLLSPAGRPVAVTSDLASFWRTGYPKVRAELRGRYPRHPWPDDPTVKLPSQPARPQPGRGG
jgi:ATP-dependent helicase HrpB